MGRRLLVEEPAFAATIDELDPMFQAEVGWSLREAIEVDQNLMDTTKSQIALYGMHVALAATWRSHGIEPGAIMGHSMGEVAAAVVAGALSPADGVKLISLSLRPHGGAEQEGHRRHGRAPGRPGRVRGRRRPVPRRRHRRLRLAEGDHDLRPEGAAERGRRVLQGARPRAWVLPVGGAAHSPQVDSITDAFNAGLAGITPLEATVPYYSTANEDPREAPSFGTDYWWRNVRHSVRFMQAITAAAEDGFTTFIEISPHPVAEITTRQTLKAAGVERRLVLPTLRRDGDDSVSLRTSLAALDAWHVANTIDGIVPMGRKVALPFWQHRRFWIDDRAIGKGLIHQDGHPLLGTHIALPEGNRHLFFKADDGTAARAAMAQRPPRPWRPVVPGAAYAEIAGSAAAEVLGGPEYANELVDLELGELLVLGEHREITTSVTVQPTAPRWSRSTRRRTTRPRRWCCAPRRPSARATRCPPRWQCRTEPPRPSICTRCSRPPVSAAAPPSLASPRRSSTTTARPAPTSDCRSAALTDRHYRVHPSIIDACFQALGVSGSRLATADGDDAAYMAGPDPAPDDLGRSEPRRARSWHASTSTRTARSASAAVRLYADDGQVLLSADGIELRRVEKSDLPELPAGEADGAPGAAVGRALILDLSRRPIPLALVRCSASDSSSALPP